MLAQDGKLPYGMREEVPKKTKRVPKKALKVPKKVKGVPQKQQQNE